VVGSSDSNCLSTSDEVQPELSYKEKHMKAFLTLALVLCIGVVIYQATQISRLQRQLAALNTKTEQLAANSAASEQHGPGAAATTNTPPAADAQASTSEKNPKELLRLRGEVGRLRVENASISATNAVSKITSNPQSRDMLRNQQKRGMNMIYKGFASNANLTPEQTEKLNDLLADHIMQNVDHVTQVLRDKPAADEMNKVFAGQESALDAQVKDLLGADGLAQYQDYTKNLLSSLTAEQFKSMLSGSDDEKSQKSKQLLALMQEQVRSALADANLPADYQLVPMLNFRNIASEQEGDKSLQMLESIYTKAAAQAGSFLSPDDLKKFEEFRTTAINNNRTALMLNRTMMAPISQ